MVVGVCGWLWVGVGVGKGRYMSVGVCGWLLVCVDVGRICGNDSIQLWWFNTDGTQMVS